MSDAARHQPVDKGAKPDRDRSGAALRSNLHRRKAQARGRAAAATATEGAAGETAAEHRDRVLKPDGLE